MSAGKLAMVCFEARTAAHIAHLKTKSYAAHKALDEFYHGIIETADAFLEAYQGAFGLISTYPDADDFEAVADPLELMNMMRKWLVAYRKDCCRNQTELENLYDGIIELVNSTRYKLKFLS